MEASVFPTIDGEYDIAKLAFDKGGIMSKDEMCVYLSENLSKHFTNMATDCHGRAITTLRGSSEFERWDSLKQHYNNIAIKLRQTAHKMNVLFEYECICNIAMKNND